MYLCRIEFRAEISLCTSESDIELSEPFNWNSRGTIPKKQKSTWGKLTAFRSGPNLGATHVTFSTNAYIQRFTIILATSSIYNMSLEFRIPFPRLRFTRKGTVRRSTAFNLFVKMHKLYLSPLIYSYISGLSDLRRGVFI